MSVVGHGFQISDTDFSWRTQISVIGHRFQLSDTYLSCRTHNSVVGYILSCRTDISVVGQICQLSDTYFAYRIHRVYCNCRTQISVVGHIWSMDSRDAALHVFNGRLDVPVTPYCIDRSHRLGRFQPSSNKPRPVIVKFVSYETRRQVFLAKRRLKGSKIVITENLTKWRSDLLNRTRAQPDIKAAWTTDGRIVCLLENCEKRTIVTERDLDQLHRHQ